MKLVTFSYKGRPRLGQIIDSQVYAMAWPDTMEAVVQRGITPSRGNEHFALDTVKLEAPLTPSKIVAIGRNYAEHAKEADHDIPASPLIFAKFPSAIIGTGEAITWRADVAEQVDWEAELAVIIGKRAKNVPEDEALSHVFGYTIANDVSARDLQLKKDAQWTRGKSLDTFCPLGPIVVTRDDIPDPQALKISTTVNGETMQDGSTADMIFPVKALIAYVSQFITLEPGDLILTGTPSGTGMGMKPPKYLKDGDVVTCTVEGIGELSNPCKVL
jgi:5-carboxymethyl-2-hydroxymuconate isomerase